MRNKSTYEGERRCPKSAAICSHQEFKRPRLINPWMERPKIFAIHAQCVILHERKNYYVYQVPFLPNSSQHPGK